MKWIAINEANTAVKVFNLVENNVIREVLRYHPQQQSGRLSGIEKQRVFFAEKAGFRNNHFIIKNEYGFENARIYIDNLTGDSGYIERDQNKTQFTLISGVKQELVIYDTDGITPMVICGLQKPIETYERISDTFSTEDVCLLWGLYWYISDTVVVALQASYSKRLSVV